MSLTTSSTGRAMTRCIGALLIAGAVLGSTAAAAQASTPAAGVGSAHHPTPATHTPTTGDAVILNASPYPAAVSDPGSTKAGWTMGPGQSVLLTAAQLQGFQGPDVQVALTLPDHSTDTYVFDRSQTQPGARACTTAPNNSSNVGCDTQAPNIQAGESGPTQYTVWGNEFAVPGVQTVDASAPGADRVAIGRFLFGITAEDPARMSFAPDTTVPPSWGSGQQTLAGAPVYNCGSGQAHEEIGGTTEHSETTSLDASDTVTASADFFDLFNASLSTTITAGDAWTTGTTSSHTESKDIDANSVGWMTVQPSTETVTGTVTMYADATPTRFTHVSVTEPGRNATGNPELDYIYTAHSLPMTQDQITQQCTAGPTALAHTAPAASLPDITAGATH